MYYDFAKSEGFKERILFILNTLNMIDFLNTGSSQDISQKDYSDEVFKMNLKKNNRDKEAKLIITDNGYKLLKNSCIEKNAVPSFEGSRGDKKRQELIHEGLLYDCEDYYITTEDIYFKSPSGASDIVSGCSTNGRIVWKNINGTTLNEYEQML